MNTSTTQFAVLFSFSSDFVVFMSCKIKINKLLFHFQCEYKRKTKSKNIGREMSSACQCVRRAIDAQFVFSNLFRTQILMNCLCYSINMLPLRRLLQKCTRVLNTQYTHKHTRAQTSTSETWPHARDEANRNKHNNTHTSTRFTRF